jgi:hypothetical protein
MSEQVLKAASAANTFTLKNNEDGTFSILKGEVGPTEVLKLDASGKLVGDGSLLTGIDSLPLGGIMQVSAGVVPNPSKYLRCDGSQKLRSSYASLSALQDAHTFTERSLATAVVLGPANNSIFSNGTGTVIGFHGSTNDTCQQSADYGATWSNRTIGSSAKSWYYGAWMGGSVLKFVGIPSSSANSVHAYSPDGATWTTASTLTAKNWSSIACNDAGTVCIVVCIDDGTTNKSTNGTSFSASGTLGSAGANSKKITWLQSAGVFVVAETKTKRFWTSTDGTAWTLGTMPRYLNEQIMMVSTQTATFVFNHAGNVSTSAIGNGSMLYKTTNGIDWSDMSTHIMPFVPQSGVGSNQYIWQYMSKLTSSGIAIHGAPGIAETGGYLITSFDDGVSWQFRRYTGASGLSVNACGPVSSNSYLVSGMLSNGSGAGVNSVATVAIDNTKLQLPEIINGYVRYA